MTRLTPVGTDQFAAPAARPLVGISGALAVVLAVWCTVAHFAEVRYPVVAVVGVALVGAAALVAYLATSPERAPFTPERLAVVMTLALTGALVEYVAVLGRNRFVWDDYGLLVIGLCILALAPYCAWQWLVSAGLLSAIVMTILVAGSAPYLAADEHTFVVVVSVLTLLLAPTAAAAAFSASAVAGNLAAQREANRELLGRDAELRSGTATSVRRSPVSVLARQVLPFLARVMTSERISVADADRARELADALRHALRSGFRSTWLDELAGDLDESHGVPMAIADPAGAAAGLSVDQRALLTGFVLWMTEGGRATSVRVAVAQVPLVGGGGTSAPPGRGGARAGLAARRTALRARRRAPAAQGTAAASPRAAAQGRIVISAVAGSAVPDRSAIDRFAPLAGAVGLDVVDVEVGENVRMELRYALD